MIPGPENLSKIKQAQGVNEGRCNSLYEGQILTRGETMKIGEVICDETKWKEGMLYNTTNRKAVGFTVDFICKTQVMKSLLDEKEIASFCRPATYVNQWRYCSVNG